MRAFTLWTPSLLRAAEVQADGGNLKSAAAICDWLLSDDRVLSVVNQRVQAVTRLVPSFEPSGDKRRSARAVRALEAEEDYWEGWPETELAQLLGWGILLGLAPARHQPSLDENSGRILPRPEFWNPQHVRFDITTRTWRARVVTVTGQGTFGGAATEEVEFAPGDGTWILHTPFGRNRPWALGSWRALAPLVLLKRYALSDWARHGEKASLLTVTQDAQALANGLIPETTKEQRKALATDIYERGRDACVVLPAGFDLRLVEAQANTEHIYRSQIDMANTAIAINIRGGNLTTEVKEGSRAAAQTHAAQNDQSNLEFDAEALSTTVHDQSLRWWALWNFGDEQLAPWPTYPVRPRKDLLTRAQVYVRVADFAGRFEALGFEIDRQRLAEEFEADEWLKPGEKLDPDEGAGGEPSPSEDDDGTEDENDGDDGEGDDDVEEGGGGGGTDGRFRLASGTPTGRARGFLEGQLYADALTERSLERGKQALKPTIDAILEELDAARDYDDLRERLRARYRTMSPEELSGLVQSAMLLGELAGRTAVNRDA
ncbi:MAG: DUF935 family protein [Pseudomonadota bacterium]